MLHDFETAYFSREPKRTKRYYLFISNVFCSTEYKISETDTSGTKSTLEIGK